MNSVVNYANGAGRSLARCGLAEPARRMLSSLHDELPKENWVIRLHVRASLAQVGGEVADAITTAFDVLGRGLTPQQRLAVVGATAELATPLPAAEAVAVWARLAPHAAINDAYSTSSHFALSFLHVAERIVVAHVPPWRVRSQTLWERLDAEVLQLRERASRKKAR